jgi:peptidoglycan/LPS O-acetylase OafA/YrhL
MAVLCYLIALMLAMLLCRNKRTCLNMAVLCYLIALMLAMLLADTDAHA